MQTTTAQSPSVSTSAKAAPAGWWWDYLIGLTLTAVLPAVFWVVLLASASVLLGYSPDPRALLAAGLAITAFLGVFFCVLTAKST
jgi:hypothetical protein